MAAARYLELHRRCEQQQQQQRKLVAGIAVRTEAALEKLAAMQSGIGEGMQVGDGAALGV